MNPAHESCVLHSVFRIQITLTRFLNQLIGWVLYINFSQMFVSHLLQILWDCNYSQFNKYKGEKRKQLTYSKKKKENRTTFTNALYLSIVPNTASWLAKNRDAILALIGSQVMFRPCDWPKPVSRESTPYITLLHFCSTNENFSTYSNTSRSAMMLPPRTPRLLNRW